MQARVYTGKGSWHLCVGIHDDARGVAAVACIPRLVAALVGTRHAVACDTKEFIVSDFSIILIA